MKGRSAELDKCKEDGKNDGNVNVDGKTYTHNEEEQDRQNAF